MKKVNYRDLVAGDYFTGIHSFDGKPYPKEVIFLKTEGVGSITVSSKDDYVSVGFDPHFRINDMVILVEMEKPMTYRPKPKSMMFHVNNDGIGITKVEIKGENTDPKITIGDLTFYAEGIDKIKKELDDFRL